MQSAGATGGATVLSSGTAAAVAATEEDPTAADVAHQVGAKRSSEVFQKEVRAAGGVQICEKIELMRNIEDAVSSVVALEKAKLVVPEFIIFVDEIEFLTKDAIDGKLWKT